MLERLIELAQINGHIDTECLFGGSWKHDIAAQHATAIIHIVTSGRGHLYLNHRQYSIQQGDILLLPYGTAHSMFHFSSESQTEAEMTRQMTDSISTTFSQHPLLTLKATTDQNNINLSLFCAHFSYAQQADLFQHLPDFIQLHLNDAQLSPLLSLLQFEAQQNLPAGSAVIDALSQVLLILIFRQYFDQPAHAESLNLISTMQRSRVGKLLRQLVDAPENNWSIEHMAQVMSVSRVQLIRIFKQELNITPHAFLTRLRLQQAALQLKKSNDSILKIAESLGFVSETHFGQTFKKMYGITPRQYRLSSTT